ncbi:MAG: hypothetical protein ABIH41_01535 [Nanoarchaeota archaeon]
MDQKAIQKHIDEGYIRCTVIFEVVGNPKKHVEDAIRSYLANVKKDTEILVVREEYAEAQEKEKLWSTFCEADILVHSLEKLTWLAFNFSPSSIEVTAPASFTFSDHQMTHWLNDVLSRLHEIGMYSKSLASKANMLEKNNSRILHNFIIAAVEKPQTAGQIATVTGLPEASINEFLDHLVKVGRLVKEGKKYARGSPK